MSISDFRPATVVGMNQEDWSSVQKRVQWVIESKRVRSGKGWALAAGLSGGYVNRMKTEPNLSPSSDTFEKLADAAGVSVRWLRFGEGAPDAQWVEPERSDPNKAIIIAMAQAKNEDPAVIRMLEETERSEGPMTLTEWEERLRQYRSIVKRNYDDAFQVVPDGGVFDVEEGADDD